MNPGCVNSCGWMVDAAVDMTVHEYSTCKRYTVNIHLHTDIFWRSELQADRNHSETPFTNAFRPFILPRYIYLEGTKILWKVVVVSKVIIRQSRDGSFLSILLRMS